jgi:hypothetical protein
VTPHIDNSRLDELGKPDGRHLTEDELEHIADCEGCGQRAFDKLFPSHHKVRNDSSLPEDRHGESPG